MIDKTKIIDTVRERLKKLPDGHYLDLRTYKRNRSVVIVKIDADNLLVIEDGYCSQRFQIKTEKLKDCIAFYKTNSKHGQRFAQIFRASDFAYITKRFGK